MKVANLLSPIYPILLIFIFTVSCNGQNTPKNKSDELTNEDQHSAQVSGDTVTEITAKGITVIFQDKSDHYWFAGAPKGVYKYDGENLILFGEKDGLCSNKIVEIQEDHYGNLYFDTQEGISKYDGAKFTTLEVIDGASFKNEWKLEQNDLWFRMGWSNDGPYRYDGKYLYQLKFPEPQHAAEFYATNPNASFSPYGIYSSYKDSKGVMWFGTASLGVCRYDGESISWLYEKQLTETPSGGSFGIRSIIEDQEGFFWFCNTHYRYDILPEVSEWYKSGFINYRSEDGVGYPKEDGALDFPYFMSIVETANGDLWMATYADGVWKNDGDKLIHYPLKDGETDILLFSIYKDNQGVLWLGTHNAGVHRYNGSDFVKFEP
jgi:ligand-binding sensor domain-containing protein